MSRMYEPADQGFMAFVHDDITWCLEDKCPVTDCMRNQANMINRTGLHSYAMFKGTAECMMSANIDRCMDGCVHAKEMFANHEDPDDALKALMDEYCDDCIFSSTEED